MPADSDSYSQTAEPLTTRPSPWPPFRLGVEVSCCLVLSCQAVRGDVECDLNSLALDTTGAARVKLALESRVNSLVLFEGSKS